MPSYSVDEAKDLIDLQKKGRSRQSVPRTAQSGLEEAAPGSFRSMVLLEKRMSRKNRYHRRASMMSLWVHIRTMPLYCRKSLLWPLDTLC